MDGGKNVQNNDRYDFDELENRYQRSEAWSCFNQDRYKNKPKLLKLGLE